MGQPMKSKKLIFSISIGLVMVVVAVLMFNEFGYSQITEKSGPYRLLYGRVNSRYGPVENARVRLPGSQGYALTDKQGQFSLKIGHVPLSRFRITTGKEGWFNNGQFVNQTDHSGEVFLNPILLDDHPDYQFNSPEICARCHVKLTRYWDRSKMAHTTSNPKVLETYYGTDAYKRPGIGPGYKLDNPDDSGNCAFCHAPSAAVSQPKTMDLDTVLKSSRTEWDGISCEYCHKVRKVLKDPSRPSGFRPVLERQSPQQGQAILVFGPYDDVAVPPMAASYNPLYDKGRFCATCHSHVKKVPDTSSWDPDSIYTDLEWKGFGLKDKSYLPIQTTYQEWKQWQSQLSPTDPNKGKKCQDCHMSWRKEMLPYDNYVVDAGARNMWGTWRSPENIRPHHFDGGTEIQLKTALSMELEGEIKGDTFIVKAYITNTNGGHWVPTGETMRSVMLVLNAVDGNGKPLELKKGSRLPDWTGVGEERGGNYAGLPGTVFARILQDDKGNIHVPFWRATGIASDTRIRPKKTVTLTYEFALTDPDDEPEVEAKLIYRPVIKPLAKKKNWMVKDVLITSSAW
jgi:hypothetical protein